VLDRIVGYKVSPLLWDKVRRGLSAGRRANGGAPTDRRAVSSRFARLFRRNIGQFTRWWTPAIRRCLKPSSRNSKGEDIAINNQEGADAFLAALNKAKWQVASVVQKEKRRYPPPPFTTSKLQQAGYNRLRYTAKRTMGIAQRLYEGVELGPDGLTALITYMRTDSVNVSQDALAQVRELIRKDLVRNIICRKSRTTTNQKRTRRKRTRPSGQRTFSRAPEDVRKYLDDDLFKLYQLIWQRFVASQIAARGFRSDHHRHFRRRLHVSVPQARCKKFDGYLRVYQLQRRMPTAKTTKK